MALVRWEPFRELANIRNAVNGIFDENFRSYPYPETGAAAQWPAFPIDISETPEDVRIKAEIPGVNREDIKVSYDNKVLTIKGERKHEEKGEGANFIRIERKYGSFSRSFYLDTPVKQDQIKATYKDGLLDIMLPKEQPAPRQINIEIEN